MKHFLQSNFAKQNNLLILFFFLYVLNFALLYRYYYLPRKVTINRILFDASLTALIKVDL